MANVEEAAPGPGQSAPGWAQEWRQALTLWAVFALATSLAMAPTLMAMANVWWNSATFNHGLLIPFIIAWLVWDRREQVLRVRPGLYPPALVLVGGAALLWLLGRVGDVQTVQQLAWVLMIQASVLALLGVAVTRALLFPLGYMFFLVPVGEFLIPPLQHFTAQFIVVMLNLIDIPVFLEDIFLSTPSGDFRVAEACSGVRFLIATLALGVLFANISFKSWKRRAIVVGLSILVPIIANGLRAFGIVYIAYLTDNEYAVGVDHIVYGWGFFAFVTIVLLIIGMSFSDKKPSDPPFDVTPLLNAGGATVAPRRTWFGVFAIAMAVGLAVPAYGAYVMHRDSDRHVAQLPELEPAVSWQKMDVAAGTVDWRPHYAAADAERFDHYRSDDVTVSLYAAVYGTQDTEREMIAFGNSVMGQHDRWSRLNGGRRQVRLGGQDVEIAFYRARGPGGAVRDIWQVFWVDNRLVAQPRWAKIFGAFAKLHGGQTAAATLVISTERARPELVRDDALAAFAAALPPVADYFAQAVATHAVIKGE